MFRYCTWRFGAYADAIRALASMLDSGESVCCRGVGDEQDAGYDLEEGDIALFRDGRHVCLTWTTPHEPEKGEWMSPCVLTGFPTYDRQGCWLGGEAEDWGVREEPMTIVGNVTGAA